MSSAMTPQEIVSELDKHIVGQHGAKLPCRLRCVTAGAVSRCPDGLRQEITPKNILMIGPPAWARLDRSPLKH